MASGREDYTESMDIASQSVDRISTITKAPTGVTPIVKSMIAEDSIDIVHTVSVGKTFYLTNITFNIGSLATQNICYLATQDEGNNLQYYIIRQELFATTDNSANVSSGGAISPPLEIAEGWDIIISSPALGVVAAVTISGWEE